jgi:hypothetical protein
MNTRRQLALIDISSLITLIIVLIVLAWLNTPHAHYYLELPTIQPTIDPALKTGLLMSEAINI